MIVNLSPASYNREETHMSLYFASNVKMIKNEPVKCVESREMSLIKQDLAMAESDRDRYREILEKHGLIDV